MIRIIEHPKCGRTFLKILLTDLNIQNSVTHAESAGIRRHYSPVEDINIEKYLKKYNIFLYRNPLDVMVSFYHQMKYRVTWKNNRYQNRRSKEDAKEDIKNISNFIRSIYGIEYLLKFYQLWDIDKDNVMFISFEDLITNTEIVLNNIFTWYDFVPNNIKEIIDKNKFENLKKKEMKKNKNEKSLKFRKGRIMGYIEYMNKDDINYCLKMIEKYPSRFV